MRLDDLRNLVRTRLGLSVHDAMGTDAVLNTLLNAALRQTSMMGEWPWLEQTATVILDPDGKIPTSGLTGLRKIVSVGYKQWDLLFQPARARTRFKELLGEPVGWTRVGQEFYCLPAPAQTTEVDVRYVTVEPELSADSDEPLMPDNFIDLLVTQTCILVARRYRNTEQEASLLIEREEVLRAMKDDTTMIGQGYRPMRIAR